MKKSIYLFITILVSYVCNTSNIYAFSTNETSTILQHSTIEYFDDGSFIETIIEQYPNTLKTSTRNGAKTKNYKDKYGKIIWSIKVEGKFTYNGKTATCIDSKAITSCNSSLWELTNKKASKSKNIAKALVTAKEYTVAHICCRTINASITLTCSPNGTLS